MLEDDIRRVLQSGRVMTRREIANEIGCNPDSIGTLLLTMEDVVRYKQDVRREYLYALATSAAPHGAVLQPAKTDGAVFEAIKKYISNHPGCTIQDINRDIPNNRRRYYNSYIDIMIIKGEIIEVNGHYSVIL